MATKTLYLLGELLPGIGEPPHEVGNLLNNRSPSRAVSISQNLILNPIIDVICSCEFIYKTANHMGFSRDFPFVTAVNSHLTTNNKPLW